MEKSKALLEEAKIILNIIKTSFATNSKGLSLGKGNTKEWNKRRRRKKIKKTNHLKKIAAEASLCIITLNVNELPF